jgi:ferrous iron transport protein B
MTEDDRKIALAGNPNSGKTTVFNGLCGARERVGNWSGTTVERKEGILSYHGNKIKVVDLPGTYSLTAYSLDERIARNFLVREKPDLVVAIIDASNLERNLYLVTQLMEFGQNVLLDLNMMDVVKSRNMNIDVPRLSKVLGLEVVETVASKGRGIDKLKESVFTCLSTPPTPLRIDYGPSIEEAIEKTVLILDEGRIDIGLPLRGLAIKYLVDDPDIIQKIRGFDSFSKMEEIKNAAAAVIQSQYSQDIETYVTEKRYAFLKGVVMECVQTDYSLEDRLTTSDMIDKVLTNKVVGVPIFIFFMFLLFKFVFALGNPMVDLIDHLFGNLRDWISNIWTQSNLPHWIGSLIADGIIAGVGGVLVFLPLILLLFLGISLLEGSGYLARAAFVMDRFMHALGLHGKSFIPMLIGFGCNIPGIMATRTLESRKDRIITILILPLMSCAARLPVYTLFAAAFFPRHEGLIVFSLYLIGVLLAIIMAKVFKSIFFREESAPLIMELPPYRMPTMKNILLHMWMRAWLFVKKAGTIILAASVIIWVLANVEVGETPVHAVTETAEYENALIGRLGKIIAPVFRPAGFGSWQASVALISGVAAKEIVVSTFGVLLGAGEDEENLREELKDHFDPLAAYSFLIMTLIYIPCVACVAVIRRETSWKWTGIAVGYSLLLGWTLSVLFYQIASLFT